MFDCPDSNTTQGQFLCSLFSWLLIPFAIVMMSMLPLIWVGKILVVIIKWCYQSSHDAVHNSSFNNHTSEKMRLTSDGNVIIGDSTGDANAILELTSTTKAFRPPRMTATQASAITASDGMMLYVTSTNATFTAVGFWGYENGAWVKL